MGTSVSNQCQQGLDTPTPFLQLSGTIMKGTPQTLLGTQLIFREADDTSVNEEGRDVGNDIESAQCLTVFL